MRSLIQLFDNNRAWAASIRRRDPEFFSKLSQQQTPGYLWIGCSDSRVPANEIVGLLPGELFVHRNVANIVVHTDLNCLSVMQFAVDLLKVRHIIVCGHYGCGGVRAATEESEHGLIDNWLRHIQEIYLTNKKELDLLNEDKLLDKLTELNVVKQAVNVCRTTILQEAWKNKQEISVHAWIYSVSNGIIKDLNSSVDSLANLLNLEMQITP